MVILLFTESVFTMTLATRSVLWSMLVAGEAVSPPWAPAVPVS